MLVKITTGDIAEIENNSLENFTSVINTNLVGPFVISKESLPHIKEAKGSIIFVASIFGKYHSIYKQSCNNIFDQLCVLMH
jgi:NAD(P)-dependent dehydrogenase (short-subunit alcohol dehydrogenase family)